MPVHEREHVLAEGLVYAYERVAVLIGTERAPYQ